MGDESRETRRYSFLLITYPSIVSFDWSELYKWKLPVFRAVTKVFFVFVHKISGCSRKASDPCGFPANLYFVPDAVCVFRFLFAVTDPDGYGFCVLAVS